MKHAGLRKLGGKIAGGWDVQQSPLRSEAATCSMIGFAQISRTKCSPCRGRPCPTHLTLSQTPAEVLGGVSSGVHQLEIAVVPFLEVVRVGAFGRARLEDVAVDVAVRRVVVQPRLDRLQRLPIIPREVSGSGGGGVAMGDVG